MTLRSTSQMQNLPFEREEQSVSLSSKTSKKGDFADTKEDSLRVDEVSDY